MSRDLPREILGSLCMEPALLEGLDLTANDFPAGRYREVFEILSAIWEDGRPKEISIAILAEKLGGNEPYHFISSFYTGLQSPSAEGLAMACRAMRKKAITARILTQVERQAKSGELSLEEIRADLVEYDQLNNPEAVFQSSLAERGAHSVKIRPVPWLWHGVMPTHMSTAITGDAGQGKSLVAVDMAARVSSGLPFPVYDKPSPTVCGHVFYVTSEGVPEMILVPRLMAAGADLSKITIIEGMYLKKDNFSMFDITQNLPHLECRAQDFPDLKLIIVDPIASFLPERINPNQTNAVRQAMDRISNLAYKLGIAAPTVMHFNKSSGGRAIHKTSGSGQFEASVKMSWSVIRREDDPRNVRVLVPQKSNISGCDKSLSFSIHPVEFPAPEYPGEIIDTAKIIYGDHVDEDPETLISPPIENDNHVASARRFLSLKLAEGTTLYAKPLIDEAEEQGVPKWALYKAKDRMGILHDKEGTFQGRTFWYQSRDKQS